MSAAVLTPARLRAQRLRSSRLSGNVLDGPAAVVGWFGAVQAQDYPGARWAVAQRTAGATVADLDRLLTEGTIVRTHVLRPTWHLVLRADIRWMLELTAPRVRALMAYQARVEGIDSELHLRTNRALEKVLGGGSALTRTEVSDALGAAGVDATGVRLGHLLMAAELDAVVCSGGVRGKQLTYALFDDRVPAAAPWDRDQALAELASRFLAGHGPAQVRDLAWWSGLTTSDATRALELLGSAVVRRDVDGTTHVGLDDGDPVPPRTVRILANYDEYLVGYADRSLHAAAGAVLSPMELLANSIVVDGLVVGSWRRASRPGSLVLEVRLRSSLSPAQGRRLDAEAQRMAAFAGTSVRVTVAAG